MLVLIPTMCVFDALHRRAGAPYGWPKAKKDRKTLLTAGVVCGTFLFLASAAQQMGIILNPSTAKAGFLTAMYVVLVPVFGLALGRRNSAQLWVSMVIAVRAPLPRSCLRRPPWPILRPTPGPSCSAASFPAAWPTRCKFWARKT